MAESLPSEHKAVRLHPNGERRIRVETIPAPRIEHPDDAIVKVKLAGLCGSDLHAYRGHEVIDQVITTGHEFVGEVVALGASFAPEATAKNRPPLYATLKVGDKVVSPFTSSCAECNFCRLGFTSRCANSLLFGSVLLEGGQAQYVRVPRAGGTLFPIPPHTSIPHAPTAEQLTSLADPSLLLLADILPTGVFAAIQTLQHPKVLPVITGRPFPLGSMSVLPAGEIIAQRIQSGGVGVELLEEDKILNLAIVGLGPVGICALISLLDLLALNKTSYNITAIDLLAARRAKASAIYRSLPDSARGSGHFAVCGTDEAEATVAAQTKGTNGEGIPGCHAVLEIVGNNSALTLAHTLLRPFGALISVGVHQTPPVPFIGRALYAKNTALEFGRCPVRAVFPLAAELLLRRQDVFGKVGGDEALVDRVVGIDDAEEAFTRFEKGEWGKVIFDPWK
ncbi:alcohol dehydrogenase [Rickenella mellea]|uniref:Alcohol dehydrogenase n=1 Tax=Rickenella mellea TaxID=50990 RepID=A0A4Y7PKQ6_9AGAM|nr:alcohol dehydrogenase [Rickenella mellea]